MPQTRVGHEPVALIGIGCRFPMASGPEAFWRLIDTGVDAITEIPPDRFDAAALYDPRPGTPGRITTRWGGFLDHIDRFDAGFFGISPREADRLDPQQRLLLEVAWEALDDAGQVREKLAGSRAGVFVGLWLNDYEARLFRDPNAIDFYMTTGSGRYSASGRLSYAFGFEGPSLTVDTACSSSLVAVHLACQSLRIGESRIALAAGANVILQPAITLAYSQSNMMAPDGRCKFGDARANGYVRSEGAGVVVLKRLSDAIADGDRIYAVILGSAVNNDGCSSGFLATPAQHGQEELLRRAYADAGVSPGRVQMHVEAHGTGTHAGDPVELGALGAVLAEGRPDGRPCRIGSVKTNIGHTEGAAGLAGLIKTTLALHQRVIPANLHFQTPNPDIPWDRLPVRVASERAEWQFDHGAPLAGVSAFGIAGTNAHVVLQAWMPVGSAAVRQNWPAAAHLLTLSAHTTDALHEAAAAFRDRLADAGAASIEEVCYTAGARRSHHEHRLACVVRDGRDAADQLTAYLRGEQRPRLSCGRRSDASAGKVVFVFPGQGSQWIGMGRRLMAEQPIVRQTLEACDAAIREFTGWSLLEELAAEEGVSRLDRIDVIQPCIFSMQVALAALWRGWGIEPAAVVGHSMGEVAAACVAGALSLRDAARIICRRSLLLRRTSGQGAMGVVELTIDQARAELAGYGDRLSVAVSNGPRSTVLSGDPAALDEVIVRLEQREIFCRRVKVDVASHSPQMDPLRADLLDALQGIEPRAPQVPFYSTVTGAPAPGPAFDPAYWVRNLREPVLFFHTVERLLDDGHTLFIEMSPHPILVPAVQEILQHRRIDSAAIGSLRRGEDEQAEILGALGAVYAFGCAIDWSRIYPDGGQLVSLPSYRWQRERYWYDGDNHAPRRRAAAAGEHPLLGPCMPSALHDGTYFWNAEIASDQLPDAASGDASLASAAALVDAAVSAAGQIVRGDAVALENITIEAPLAFDEGATLVLQTIVSPRPDGRRGVQMSSRPAAGAAAESEWTRHLTAELVAIGRADGASIDRAIAAPQLAAAFAALGRAASGEPADTRRAPVELVSIDRLVAGPGAVAGSLPECRVSRVQADETGEACGDLQLVTSDGAILVEMSAARLRPVPVDPIGGAFFAIDWQPQPAAAPARAAGSHGPWLILGDRAGVGEKLAARLERAGEPCVLVPAGADARDSLHQTLRGVVHLRSLDLPADDTGAIADGRLDANCASVLDIVHGLAAAGSATAPRLFLVTSAVQPIGAGAAVASVAQAPVWGLGSAIAAEHPEFTCVRIDVSAAPDDREIDALARELHASAEESQVALRGGDRFVARLVRWQPRRRARSSDSAVDPGAGTYLVTGGLGALGLAVARWLVARGARHLVLMGRRGPSPDASSAIEALNAAGASILVVSADVARADDVMRALDHVRASMPPLRGIVHAAGIVDDGILLQLDAERFEAVTAPKARGAWNLHAATLDDPLDFFVMFSSVASFLISAGHGNYAAANAFLDAFAPFRRALGRCATTINWGPWGERGLAAAQADRLARLSERGLDTLASDAGLAALARIIEHAPARVAVMHFDANRWCGAPDLTTSAALFANLCSGADAASAESGAEEAIDLAAALGAIESGAERRRFLEDYVQAQVARVLRLAPARIDPTKPFRTMGLDSLMGLELRNRLEPRAGITIPATLVWNYPTVVQFAAQLASRMGVALDGAAPDETGAASEGDGDLAALLGEVEQLSDEDAKRLLAE